jgi:hypothetical protein
MQRATCNQNSIQRAAPARPIGWTGSARDSSKRCLALTYQVPNEVPTIPAQVTHPRRYDVTEAQIRAFFERRGCGVAEIRMVGIADTSASSADALNAPADSKFRFAAAAATGFHQ